LSVEILPKPNQAVIGILKHAFYELDVSNARNTVLMWVWNLDRKISAVEL